MFYRWRNCVVTPGLVEPVLGRQVEWDRAEAEVVARVDAVPETGHDER